MARIGIQARVLFQIPEGNHGADRKRIGCFFNGVQMKIAQINGGINASLSHFQPQHAAYNAVAPRLIQIICFFQALRSDILLYGDHSPSPFPQV